MSDGHRRRWQCSSLLIPRLGSAPTVGRCCVSEPSETDELLTFVLCADSTLSSLVPAEGSTDSCGARRRGSRRAQSQSRFTRIGETPPLSSPVTPVELRLVGPAGSISTERPGVRVVLQQGLFTHESSPNGRRVEARLTMLPTVTVTDTPPAGGYDSIDTSDDHHTFDSGMTANHASVRQDNG